MSRPLSADELNKLAGKRLSRDERADWRNEHHDSIVTNSEPNADINPYDKVIADLNPYSRNPTDQRRFARMQQSQADWSAQRTNDLALDARRLLMAEDPDVIKAQENFATVLNTISTETAEDLREKNRATDILQQVADGDKSVLPEYWKVALQLTERKLEASKKAAADLTTAKHTASADEAKEQAHLERLRSIELGIPTE